MKSLYILIRLFIGELLTLLSFGKNKVILVNYNELLFVVNNFFNMFLNNKPFYDTKNFPYLKCVEENWKTMEQEVHCLLENQDAIPSLHEIDTHQARLTTDKKWKAFILKVYGKFINKNCDVCPKTTEIIKSVPNVVTAMFSILSGNKHIPLHKGIYKGVVRYHLGLIIPEDKKCRIKILGETKYLEESKAIIFDDTYPHEVWNDSSKDRVILFLDIERPFPYKWLENLNKKVIKILEKTEHVQEILQKA